MRKKHYVEVGAVAFVALFPAGAANCQAVDQSGSTASPASGASSDQNEIVVTALKRSDTIQKVPLAISAVTGDSLSSMGITDSSSLARVSPGLILRESSLSGSRLTLRNIQSVGEPTVGLYYDETPISNSAGVSSDSGGSTPNFDLYDAERVEVLRGPQGTLYGSSSMGGAVRLILAKPDLAQLKGSFNAKVMSVDGGDLGAEGQGMINIPIVDGRLGVRVVGFYKNRPGYVDNIALDRSNLNGIDSYGGRVLVRFKPTDNFTLDGMVSLQNLTGGLSTYLLSAGSYNQDFRALQEVDDRNEIYSGTANWDIGPVVITLTGSHLYRDFKYSYDSTPIFENGVATNVVGSAAYNAYLMGVPSVSYSPQITKTDSFEARVSSNGSGPIDWTAGFFFSNRRGYIDSDIVQADKFTGKLLPVNDTTLLGQRKIRDQLKQIAGFGEVTWHVTSKFSATGGLRYYKYDREFAGEVTKENPFVGFSKYPYTEFVTSEDGFLYKANLSYQFTNYIMTYATVSTGQRPGGVNTALGIPQEVQSYNGDNVTNYELGAKLRLLGGALTLNGAAFQLDWDDIQTQAYIPNSAFSFIANAGKARIRGIELEAVAEPMRGLRIDGSASYIDSKLLEDQSNQNLVASGLKGDPIPMVPNVTAQGGIQYSWGLGSALSAKLRGDAQFQGGTWTRFRHTSAVQGHIPAYATFNIRAELSDDDNAWSASLFINNVANSDAVTNKFASTIYGANNVRAISVVPRTIGLELSRRF
ncbi:MAG: TonB-dependent receptor [Sphingobium sp.]